MAEKVGFAILIALAVDELTVEIRDLWHILIGDDHAAYTRRSEIGNDDGSETAAAGYPDLGLGKFLLSLFSEKEDLPVVTGGHQRLSANSFSMRIALNTVCTRTSLRLPLKMNFLVTVLVPSVTEI